ncbi:ParB/RepB/Spo0J family partition protein [Phenylobacterium ferrooxidans]|uniref:ParB/RepB/Spo0J family partition protein n=1 Tax=Phenylobacterium ferrooxidans TaxID=2982689 RepID=A0ABW6CNN6_9CAUL
MATSAPVDFPISQIVVRRRLRPINPSKVANLRVSMQENGFFGSITLRPVPGEDGSSVTELVAGAHRIAAWSAEGHKTIPSTVRILTDDEAQQIEIDENLLAPDLNPLERAEMLLARHAIWARRNPDRIVVVDGDAKPKRGRPAKTDRMSQFPETMGFAVETAGDLGITRRTVERAWATVNGLPADLRAQLHGTPVARNEGALRQLAAIGDKAEQAKVAEILLSGATKSVGDARAIAAGNAPSSDVQTPVDETLKAFRGLWGKATPAGRAAILHDLAGRKLPEGWSLTEAGGG